MNIRKIISLAAASVLTVTMLVGCGGGTSSDSGDQAETTTEAAAEPAPVVSAAELVKEMKLGWNLGNTLDASQPTWTKVTDAVKFETSWGNVQTTQEIIDTVKAAGFNVVRIPVTWDVHIGDAPDYTIQPEWIGRAHV